MKPSYALYALLLFLCPPARPQDKCRLPHREAPATLRLRFETSKGRFCGGVPPAWSPLAVDRAYQPIKSGFYNDAAIFRVVRIMWLSLGLK